MISNATLDLIKMARRNRVRVVSVRQFFQSARTPSKTVTDFFVSSHSLLFKLLIQMLFLSPYVLPFTLTESLYSPAREPGGTVSPIVSLPSS